MYIYLADYLVKLRSFSRHSIINLKCLTLINTVINIFYHLFTNIPTYDSTNVPWDSYVK